MTGSAPLLQESINDDISELYNLATNDEQPRQFNLSDQNCNYRELHTRFFITNPKSTLLLQQADRVLVLGSIPVKECETHFISHKMKQRRRDTMISVGQERRQLAVNALEAKIKKRTKGIGCLVSELEKRTKSYAQFTDHSQNLLH